MKPERRIDVSNIAGTIVYLAEQAQRRLPADSVVLAEAIRRTRTPIDYMRCAEFNAVLHYIVLGPGKRVLDVASPQWFSLFLAHTYPKVDFTYVNLSEAELAAVRDTASVLGISNIRYLRQDARELQFADDFYDACVSISVIEHTEPEAGGDRLALKEIRRVLRPGGDLWLTVPVKERAQIVYTSHPNYEGQHQNSTGQYFFAREYSLESWAETVGRSGFAVLDQVYIIEKPGPLALDYWIFGGGRGSTYGKMMRLLIKAIARLGVLSFQKILAERNLRLADHPAFRLANIAAHLRISE